MDRRQRDQYIEALGALQQLFRTLQWTAEEWREIQSILRTVDEACQKAFSPARGAYYHEIFDGLLQAGEQAAANPVEDRGAVRQLSIEILQLAVQALSTETEIKKEVVFLPYKASMWDSLESVWQAAAADKAHCNTYVVPIPYADLNPDRSAREWHCEAEDFPSYVPVLDWRDFTLEKLRAMHPDIIFIHNPYDDCNYVTSVDAQYYSKNLKECTDELVYIPYFVMGEELPETFCEMPGVFYADHVIVQSEAHKKQYEKHYFGIKAPEGKFLPLGSPKFDKVLSSRKQDFHLPKAWADRIKDRKVILYNTSLSTLLKYNQDYLQKLEEVMHFFRGKSDVALWWRPHPLMEASLTSMRPMLYPAYEQIKNRYIEEAWGIYDDSPNLYRAITYSDAYYGDWSSLVWLYQKTGKPILIQSIEGETAE